MLFLYTNICIFFRSNTKMQKYFVQKSIFIEHNHKQLQLFRNKKLNNIFKFQNSQILFMKERISDESLDKEQKTCWRGKRRYGT